ncbi:hypothetical protein [Persephonella sp.]
MFFSFAEEYKLPDISGVVDFSYVYRSVSDSVFENSYFPGFEDTEHSHGGFNRQSGFNLNYIEIKGKYQIEDNVSFKSVFHISENSFNVDEAFLKWKKEIFYIKGGKFRSSAGIMNSLHQHQLFFTNMPLIYTLFFSEHGLIEKGIEIAGKTDRLEAGFELLNGDNPQSFGYTDRPSLFVLWLKDKLYGIRYGFSALKGKKAFHHETVTQTGDTTIYMAEITAQIKKLKLQGEVAYRTIEDHLKYKQAGYYIQAVYMVSEKVNAGFRYDNLFENSINENKITGTLEKYSVGLNIFPQHNIKLRVQYSLDCTRYIDGLVKNIDEFTVEMTILLGSHHH